MPNGSRCPDCGSSELVEDSHYSQSQLVCSDCGCVVTEGVLTTTFSDEGNFREVTYSRSTGENEQVSRCQQRDLRRVRDLCRILKLPLTFEDTAISYYQKAYQLSGIRAARLQKKEVLVGCCVLITCRQHNWPLTMGTICTLLYADLDLFSGTYMQMVKLLGLDVPSLCLADLVKSYCSRSVIITKKEKKKSLLASLGIVLLSCHFLLYERQSMELHGRGYVMCSDPVPAGSPLYGVQRCQLMVGQGQKLRLYWVLVTVLFRQSHTAQAALARMAFLSLSSQCWDYKCAPLSLACLCFALF